MWLVPKNETAVLYGLIHSSSGWRQAVIFFILCISRGLLHIVSRKHTAHICLPATTRRATAHGRLCHRVAFTPLACAWGRGASGARGGGGGRCRGCDKEWLHAETFFVPGCRGVCMYTKYTFKTTYTTLTKVQVASSQNVASTLKGLNIPTTHQASKNILMSRGATSNNQNPERDA